MKTSRSNRPHRSLILRWLKAQFKSPQGTPLWATTSPLAGQVSVAYIGHGTVGIQYHNAVILVDPLLTSSAGGFKRNFSAGIAPEALEQVNLVLLSSLAFDSTNRESLKKISRRASLIVPPGGATIAKGLGFSRVCEISVGETIGINGIEIETTFAKRPEIKGTPGMSFLIRGDGPSVFYAGQTGMSDSFETVGLHGRPEIALLPIGGYYPMVQHNLTPEQTIDAFCKLGSRALVPIRYNTFTFTKERDGEPLMRFLAAARDMGLRDNVNPLKQGRSITFGEQRESETEPHWVGTRRKSRAKGSLPPPNRNIGDALSKAKLL